MKRITIEDLQPIAIGATLLGSGGGGDPTYDCMRVAQLIQLHGPITVVNVDDLSDDALIVPVGFMGAPLVSIEKLPSGLEWRAIFKRIEARYGRKIDALLATEIGGSNAFAALGAALETGLPVIDGDTIGRAFPQLEMSVANLADIPVAPAFLSDSFGNVTELSCTTAAQAERYLRGLTSAMGSSAALAMYIMTGAQAKKTIIKGSLSRTRRLGIREEEYTQNRVARGVITDIEQTIDGGFLVGKIIIEDNATRVSVHFQNEYLMVFHDGKALAETPDIIALLERETELPLSVEQVKFGLQVDVVMVPSDAVWKTEKGLALVGPKAFGYEDRN